MRLIYNLQEYLGTVSGLGQKSSLPHTLSPRGSSGPGNHRRGMKDVREKTYQLFRGKSEFPKGLSCGCESGLLFSAQVEESKTAHTFEEIWTPGSCFLDFQDLLRKSHPILQSAHVPETGSSPGGALFPPPPPLPLHLVEEQRLVSPTGEHTHGLSYSVSLRRTYRVLIHAPFGLSSFFSAPTEILFSQENQWTCHFSDVALSLIVSQFSPL